METGLMRGSSPMRRCPYLTVAFLHIAKHQDFLADLGPRKSALQKTNMLTYFIEEYKNNCFVVGQKHIVSYKKVRYSMHIKEHVEPYIMF